MDAIHGGGGGPDRDGGYKAGLWGLRSGWPVTCHSCLVWHLWRHLREGSTWQRTRRRKLSDPCQELRWRQVGREARKTRSWSAGPGQRAAAPQVSRGGDEGFRTRQTSCSVGVGRNVRGEAAELLRQVAPQGQDGCTELGQLWVLQAGAGRVHIRGLWLQGGLSCCRPGWGLLLGLSEERTNNMKFKGALRNVL